MTLGIAGNTSRTGGEPSSTIGGGAAVTSGGRPVSEERTDASAGGLPPLAGANLPSAPVPGAGALRPIMARFGKLADAEGYFDLIAGRYPECVSLDAILGAIGNNPQGQIALQHVLDAFSAKTGYTVPPSLVQAILRDPAKLAGALALSPKQLSQGADRIVQAYRLGVIHDAAPKVRQLPLQFDLANFSSAPVTRPEYTLKPIAGNLYQGDIKSDLPDDQAKKNIALAEIFDRLAVNPEAAAGQAFSVVYQGKTYGALGPFVDALAAAGHTVDVEFVHRIANFTDLKCKLADGSIHDVPAALLVRTGVRDASGKEAIVPAAHGAMVIHVRSNDQVQGPRIDADVQFFQGMDSTGFVPRDIAATPRWLGEKSADPLSGSAALQAVEIAGLLSDVINTVAKENNLPFGAYGVTGVCMDSGEVVRHAATGHLGWYPLLMRDALLFPVIEERIAQNAGERPLYAKLKASVEKVPTDVRANPSQLARILNSIPWPEGQEPFQAVVDARHILEEAASAG